MWDYALLWAFLRSEISQRISHYVKCQYLGDLRECFNFWKYLHVVHHVFYLFLMNESCQMSILTEGSNLLLGSALMLMWMLLYTMTRVNVWSILTILAVQNFRGDLNVSVDAPIISMPWYQTALTLALSGESLGSQTRYGVLYYLVPSGPFYLIQSILMIKYATTVVLWEYWKVL